ncbi:hypothetical protein RJ639_015728 [Escallonia herrerae]|uniref:Threonine dehydratase n=1 Tax=Escallonia herrerae TaxID=1293975 RepID=A0AA88VG13_9ASTE|nr:hypothetical protein RJ639_015728 [Escallonia herrerae]
MEALHFAPSQQPLLRRKFAANPLSHSPVSCGFRTNKVKPFISAKSTAADISLEPAVATELLRSPSSSPPPLLKVSPGSLQYEPGEVGAVPDRLATEGDLSAMEYLTNILASKVYDDIVYHRFPISVLVNNLKDKCLRIFDDWLCGGLQVFSFKLRGAYNMMAKLPKEQLERGVICSSAGNHAQGVALAAKRLGCNAVIVMPVTTPEIKWKSVERLGATVVLVGDSYDEAQTYAKKKAEEEGRTFVPPFDHPDVIMGQGTVGMEIVRQMQGPLHAIFVPVGGGGLIAGIAAYIKRVSPEVKVIGVEPSDANAMALSLHHRQRVVLDQVGGFADGVAVKVVGEETFRLCRELIDGVVLVNRDAICASIKASFVPCNLIFAIYFMFQDMFEEKRSILEPAGALALAGAEAYCKYYNLKDANVVAITSGANMNFDRLRLVTELADIGRQREAVLATYMPEEPGSFKLFSEQMGSPSVLQNELLCRFVFPERPGALMKFLDAFSPRWNITLFHYRGQGDTGANVLVGIQVASTEMDDFRSRANDLGYEYAVETNNEAYLLLMR